MAQIVLGAKTILNLSTDLDPMFTELYQRWSTAAAALTATNITYSGTLTGGTGVINIGSNQIYKDASGNIGFGLVPIAGAKLDVGGNISVRSAAGVAAQAEFAGNGGTFAGTSMAVGQDSVGWGIVFNRANTPIYFGTNGAERLRIEAAGNVTPGADNTQSLGSAGKRWSTVFAGTGAINTSDAREKTQVHQLTADELSAAKQIAREFGTYQFLSAVQEKGDAARMHAGTTVQRVIQIMEYFGLDAMRYAFICYDEWDAEHDSDGNETRAAGNRYSFRPDELMMFVARGIAARQDELEARLAALEL
jgi:hypothetical protein